ncbi:peroxidase 39-like [Chenopodium quinoa]|uniref:Peroxidase n=1 Tax=Chenopodium quinoa TaxID=63459 RepID=A0A803MSQ2_CHEQI|nr:peroxidase 39-like [Chenopodium quinoa]
MVSKVLLMLLILAICSTFVICNAGGSKKKFHNKHKEGWKNGHDYDSYEPKYDGDGLKDNFYHKSCPRAEKIVQSVTERHVSSNPNLPAKLIRVLFHDCFVRGCDASVLLNSTGNIQSEKDANANRNLAGFDVIDSIKAEVEKVCQETVSCADILALATRDAVSLQYGRPLWKVPTGRRDGTISLASETSTNIPSGASNFTVLSNIFANKSLSVHDLVALSGAHTIGVGHCNFFSRRLFNFTGKGDQDSSLDPNYADFLRTQCKNSTDRITTVAMDPGSSVSFDNHYFEILKDRKGLFVSDAALLTDDDARRFALKLLNPKKFFDEFAKSMEKMGAIGVLTGSQGQIRKHCSLVN